MCPLKPFVVLLVRPKSFPLFWAMTASFSMWVDQVVLPHGISGEHSNPCTQHVPCPTATCRYRNVNHITLHSGILEVLQIWPISFRCVPNITDAPTKEVGNFHSMHLLVNSQFASLVLLAFALQFPNQCVFALRDRNLFREMTSGFL